MPLGDEDLGDLDAGNDPALFTPPARARRQAALYFDPATRDFPLDTDGRYVELHPVDAGVEADLFFLQRRVPAAPTLGNTLDKIVNPHDPRAPAEAEQRIRARLLPRIQRGDIALLKVLMEPVQNGGTKVEVHYQNLRLPTGSPPSKKVLSL